MNEKYVGVVYILVNPSFPDYVKIGYADDVVARVKQLNSSEAVPFSFRIFATYDVTERLSDMKFHNFLDTINPELRSIENDGSKIRKREFYHIRPEEIYSAFENLAEFTGTKSRLHLWKETQEDINENNEAIKLSKNRHHFKSIEFHASLTNKNYYSKTKDDGTLGIFEKETNKEVPNNSNPSKRKILYSALEDLGGDLEGANTLYQIAHKLEKIILKK